MKTYLMFLAIADVIAGAYLDLLWVSAIGLALGVLFAALPKRRQSMNPVQRQNPPTVYRK